MDFKEKKEEKSNLYIFIPLTVILLFFIILFISSTLSERLFLIILAILILITLAILVKQDYDSIKKNESLYIFGPLDKEERIERITNQLPLSKEKVKKWLNNFKMSEQEFALRLLEHFRYIDKNDLRSMCKELYVNLLEEIIIKWNDKNLKPNEIIFISIGGVAKSGEMLRYHFRLANTIPLNQFIDLFDPNINSPVNKYIVYIDDLSGSGKQFLTDIEAFKKKIKKRFQKHYKSFFTLNKFIFLPLFITKDALQLIEQEPLFNCVYLPNHLLVEKDIALSLEAGIFRENEIEQAKKLFKDYGEQLYRIGPLGFGGTGLLIAFSYNTPNNTLPVIWQKCPSHDCSSNIHWEPIFPRFESRKKN